MRDELVTDLVRNPVGLVRAGGLVRSADLRAELAELRERTVPLSSSMSAVASRR